jgi:leucyl-tRNA synthetase
LCEELWEKLGHRESVFSAEWPNFDESKIKSSEVEIVIQILGKVRSRLTVPTDLDETALRQTVFNDTRIQELLQGQTIRKFIVVPNKLVNIVV